MNSSPRAKVLCALATWIPGLWLAEQKPKPGTDEGGVCLNGGGCI